MNELGTGASHGWPLVDPIVQTSAYAFPDGRAASQAAALGEPLYARDGLPNVTAFERFVAEWEGAEAAIAVTSGMAAVTLTLLSLLCSGDRVLVARDAYPETRELTDRQLRRFGIAATFVDFDNAAALDCALALGPKLVMIETISNPGMRVADLPTVIEAAHRAGALVCVDNTFASPALCRPLAFGADLVLHSAGKLLAGHHDVTAGVIAGRAELIERLREDACLFGFTLAPMEAWLAARGMRTLRQRIAWVNRTAEAIVPQLSAHEAIAVVRYPGSASGPDRDRVERVLPNGGGGLLAIELAGGHSAAEAFIAALRSIPYAATVGGPTTTVSYPPLVRGQSEMHDASGTVRISLGLEDADDIWSDFAQALAHVLADSLQSLEVVF